MNLHKLKLFAVSSQFRRGQFRRRFWPLARHVLNTVQAVGVETDGMLFFTHSADNVITYALLARGEWQRAESEKTLRLLKGKLKENGVFINVGANIGTTLIYAMQSGLFGSAIAFEPEPRNFRILKANLAVNDINNCTVIQAAVSDKNEPVLLELNQKNRGDHRVVQPGLSDARRERISVPTYRLDDFLRNPDVEPESVALVWVDTQGYENAVLNGAVNLLSAGVPLVIEFSPKELRATGTLQALIALLSKHYRTYVDLSITSEAQCSVRELQGLAASLGNKPTDLLFSTS